jgi:hypothetical protein
MSEQPLNPAKVPADHPTVVKAMRLYDEILDDEEKRNVYQYTIIAVVSAKAEKFTEHMTRFAGSILLMLDLHFDPKFRDASRASRNRPRRVDCVDVADVIASLRSEDGAR